MFEHIFSAVQQNDLERERKRLEGVHAFEQSLREQRKQAGLLSISDMQTWLDGQAEREAEKARPSKESSDVDVSRPSSSSRFPPPPRRA